jgi:hypothetical protein
VASHKEHETIDPQLTAAGFDPAAAPADAVRKLGELRNAGSVDGATIAHALGGINDIAAATMLAEMERSATGVLRREVRRALYRLHQRGIEPPTSSQPATGRAISEPVSAGITGLMSPPDREGVRIVWLVRERMGGRLARLFALDSRDEGLIAAETAELSRKEFKADRERLEQNTGTKLVDVEGRFADFLLCDAYRRTPENRRGRVGNFLALRAELTSSPPPSEFRHPVYDDLAAESEHDPSPDLLKEPEFLEWRLPDELIKKFADEIHSAQESVIVVSPIQQRERVNETIEHALESILSGESGERLRRSLEDLAYFMARAGRRQQAGWAVAAAKKIRDGGDVKHDAFFQSWIRMQLGAVFAEEQQRAAEEPRLIMTPAEAMRAQQRARRR